MQYFCFLAAYEILVYAITALPLCGIYAKIIFRKIYYVIKDFVFIMKIWYKLVKSNKLIRETVIENTEDISRTKRIFGSLEQVCHDWDLAVPVWFESTIKDFQKRSRARFTAESFPEQVEFDYLEIHVIEE